MICVIWLKNLGFCRAITEKQFWKQLSWYFALFKASLPVTKDCKKKLFVSKIFPVNQDSWIHFFREFSLSINPEWQHVQIWMGNRSGIWIASKFALEMYVFPQFSKSRTDVSKLYRARKNLSSSFKVLSDLRIIRPDFKQNHYGKDRLAGNDLRQADDQGRDRIKGGSDGASAASYI